METQNGTSSSRGGGGQTEAIEVRFEEFSKNGLSLDENASEHAMKVLKESKHLLLTNLAALGSGSLEEAERYWFVCICYVVKRLGEQSKDDQGPSSNDKGLTLCQIMRLAKLNIQDFFKELTQFIVKAGPLLSRLYGAEWENKLEAKELQANFDHLIILSRFYKRVYKELFLTHNANEKQSAVVSQAAHPSDYHRFGWLLFLALRIHTFSHFKDLVTCTNGLISVLAILILHMPVRFRNFSLNDSQLFVKRGDKGVDLLASLSNKHDASEEELKKMMDITNNLIADIFKKKSRPAAECNSENLLGIDGDGLVYYEDLMDESYLRSSLSTIEKDYEDAIQMSELDERIFISDDDSILCSKSLSAVAVDITGTPRKLDMTMTPKKTITTPLSSHWSPMPRTNRVIGSNCKLTSTPVTDAMTTSKWLRTIISPHPSRPSARLERFLTSCDKDVTADVVRRAEIILEAIFPSSPSGERCVAGSLQSTNLMDNIWAEQRREEALKLYFRVLEAMCVAESQILHATNLTSLLTSERFHRCMLACSGELVLATHKTVTMLFPFVLERTGITAFDLSKVIESFVRHEESLPRELRRHLNSLEERLLESMVWERGSSMYNSLIVARPSLSAEIHQLSLLAEPMPSLDSIAMLINFSSGGLSSLPSAQRHDNAPGQNGDIRSPKRQCTDYRSVLVERNPFTSPVKDRLLTFSGLKSKLPPPALQSAFSSPTRPNPSRGGETCAETGISVFFSKISKLAAVRINGMVEKLQPSQQHIRENTYCLFQQILSHRTSLFFNRHIDQIILCCFYGIAKISKVNLTFKEIVNNYRKQPQCKPQVFRCVFVDWSSANHYARTGQCHLDIIGFYNEVFVPAAKPLLVEVGSAGISTAPEVNNKKDGPCPASPASPFPSLPDMSPKKVSSGRNVYVSPLRTAKMDSLISQGSKSYYACVGESTQAFQSPSKDLTDINNRLNGGRKIRGALNFNDPEIGLVSDSMVANTLYLQNGSCGSSSGTTMKPEQPDS